MKESRARASHSDWKVERRAGMEVCVGGRGGAIREVLMGMRSSTVRGSEVIGSVPWVEM